ncbi:hypothetical protein F4820DRAFT_401799 [Hypoxylon rubiginosum]|uniref:Uncharacterized protein n=1 Tax=Hypoxylon rubiginosum TaxID=110542 RepID=A0ACB9ZHF9_9PEZI|nr:hypothetical protein F4820DRAFT_401799 [Hypoxylon rubiginosum]
MPSNNGFDPSNGDLTPTTNPPWPNITPIQQAQIERKLFEEGAAIHLDRLPIRSGGFLGGYPVTTYIIMKVLRSANAVQRPLTAGEVDATSEAAAISSRYASWLNPLTFAGSLCFSWVTRKSYSFAFIRPKAFNPLVFPSKRAPLFRDITAVRAWQTIRVLTYLPPFWLVNAIFFASMTETTYEAHVMRDPRLTAWRQEVKTNSLKNASARAQQRNIPVRGGTEIPRRQHPSESGDQASQHGGREPYTSQPDNAFGGSGSAPGTGATSPTPRPTWTRAAQSQAPPSSQPRDDVSDLFEDDDGSPVSASARRAEAQQARSTQGSSSWDRLRQQAQSGSAQWTRGDSSGQERGWGQLRQDKTQNTKEVPRNTEGFAYTKEEEEKEQKNYEKEQAQKEFDALLEAERRGDSGRR